jgi:hypothetical protein
MEFALEIKPKKKKEEEEEEEEEEKRKKKKQKKGMVSETNTCPQFYENIL